MNSYGYNYPLHDSVDALALVTEFERGQAVAARAARAEIRQMLENLAVAAFLAREDKKSQIIRDLIGHLK